jgi:TRAP-type C4-dicarboxylate transport system permease large subunit
VAWLGAAHDQVGTVTVGLIGPSGFVITWRVVAIVLGCIIDSISNMRMLLPIATLGAQAAGFDMIGFGVKTLVAIEIGVRTPPLGLTCLAIKSVMNDPELRVGYRRRGAFPFVLRKTRRRVILATFRGIATRLAQPQGALP